MTGPRSRNVEQCNQSRSRSFLPAEQFEVSFDLGGCFDGFLKFRDPKDIGNIFLGQ